MRWVRIFGAALAACGCGGDGDGGDDGDDVGFPRACDESDVDGDCVLFSGDGWTAEDVGAACDSGGSLAAACPPAAVLGVCTLSAGNADETQTSFYTPFWSGSQAAQQCQGQGGSWAGAQ